MNFRDCLIAQLAAHPSATPQDVIKQCYQAAFGAEHMLTDTERAVEYLEHELSETPASDAPLCERIAPEAGRVNLAAWKARGLNTSWLMRMFLMSAKPLENGADEFKRLLTAADDVVKSGHAHFEYDEWRTYIDIYLAHGIRAVHHSEQYRSNERPAYRVIGRNALNALPILERANALMNAAPHDVHVIAIDGRAASGKTTLCSALADILGASVVHMDDFFLPIPLRTPERYAQPGGNVHYERVSKEVLPHLHEHAAFDYRIFDCSCMDYGVMRNVASADWRIVEGSYSLHPALGSYADLSVFCSISPDEQRKRILRRNGELMANMFAERWIPLEEAYFKAFSIRDKADIIVRTDV